MPFTREDNESKSRFLQRLGILSDVSQGSVERAKQLDWSNLKKIAKSPTWNTANPIVNSQSIVNGDDANCEVFFNSYSGADVNIYLLIDRADVKAETRNFCPMREIQTLSVTSARSVHPVRRLGESHVVEYTRGARTIAGTMVCVSGDADPFARLNMKSIREKRSDSPFFTDELPMFSILIIASDEYGHVSHAGLTDITITNFGQTFSESDMYLENTYTYVARYYHPLLPDPDLLNRYAVTSPGTNKLSRNFLGIKGTGKLVRKVLDYREMLAQFPLSEVDGIQDWVRREKEKKIK